MIFFQDDSGKLEEHMKTCFQNKQTKLKPVSPNKLFVKELESRVCRVNK